MKFTGSVVAGFVALLVLITGWSASAAEALRGSPYGAFNFCVSVGDSAGGAGTEIGGFSEVSGLATDVTIADYRAEGAKARDVKAEVGRRSPVEIRLKRGKVDAARLNAWLRDYRVSGSKAARSVIVSRRDPKSGGVLKWRLRAAIPQKYTGPSLEAKSGADVTIEELVLVAEAVEPA